MTETFKIILNLKKQGYFLDLHNQNGKKSKDTSFPWNDLETETPYH